MENKMSRRQELIYAELVNCEYDLIIVAQKVGINNKLEIFDADLIQRFINLKTKLSVLTNQFLYNDSKTINS